jgi:hypothetical protein
MALLSWFGTAACAHTTSVYEEDLGVALLSLTRATSSACGATTAARASCGILFAVARASQQAHAAFDSDHNRSTQVLSRAN